MAPRQMGRQKEKPSEKLRQRTLEIILPRHRLRLLHGSDASFEQKEENVFVVHFYFYIFRPRQPIACLGISIQQE